MLHLPTLLIQVAIIILLARVAGGLVRKLGQPQVVGEMIAGLALGPSLLGWLSPQVSMALFPPESLGYLSTLSQFGLLLFMFLVGLEFNPKVLSGRGHSAIVTSHASIIAPFFLGTLLALYLYPRLSDESVSFLHFALFLGTAMSITAFPVLARILIERQLLRSKVGTVAIACAAVDDVTAWIILAGVVLLVRTNAVGAPLALTFAGSLLYVAIMLWGVRRIMGRLGNVFRREGAVTTELFALIVLLILGSSLITELLGIHALFGAFLLGVVMPKDYDFVRLLSEKLESFVTVLLLPLYFAFTGLRTSLNLLTNVEMWSWCLLIIGVAVLGKFGGAALSARVTGLSWRDAGAIGILMNTRGLMELVILNIGLDIGAISPALFTMMVLMALVTTFMSTPLLELFYPAKLRWRDLPEVGAAETV